MSPRLVALMEQQTARRRRLVVLWEDGEAVAAEWRGSLGQSVSERPRNAALMAEAMEEVASRRLGSRREAVYTTVVRRYTPIELLAEGNGVALGAVRQALRDGHFEARHVDAGSRVDEHILEVRTDDGRFRAWLGAHQAGELRKNRHAA